MSRVCEVTLEDIELGDRHYIVEGKVTYEETGWEEGYPTGYSESCEVVSAMVYDEAAEDWKDMSAEECKALYEAHKESLNTQMLDKLQGEAESAAENAAERAYYYGRY